MLHPHLAYLLCSTFQTTNHTSEPLLTPQAVASRPGPLLVGRFQWIWPDSSHVPATWIPHVFSRPLPAPAGKAMQLCWSGATSSWVTLCTSALGACWDLSLVMRKVGWGWGSQVSCKAPASWEAIPGKGPTVNFTDLLKQSPKGAPLAKKLVERRNMRPPASVGSAHAPTLIVRVLFLRNEWPSFQRGGLTARLGRTREAALGAPPALAADPSYPACVVPAVTVLWSPAGPGLAHFMLRCFLPRSHWGHGPCHLHLVLFGVALPPTDLAFGLAPHHGLSAWLPVLSLLGTFCLTSPGISHILLLSWPQPCESGASGCPWGEEPHGVIRPWGPH